MARESTQDIPQDALDAARQLRKKIDADPRTYETDAERDVEWDQIVAAALAAYAEKQRAVVVEACAKRCDDLASKKAAEYKTGHGINRGSPYVEGQSDGADTCANLIRALSAPGPSSP